MQKQQLLPFITNEALYREVEKVITVAKNAVADSEKKLYTNGVDPFSALFDASCQGIRLVEWLKQEKSRQVQKTLQNSLGTFHQEILGSCSGWKSLGKGKVIDLENVKKKIVAEIKNKHNTTKGNHKTVVYDDLKAQIKEKNGYTGYYVEIIPKAKKVYNQEFVPPDNKTKKRRSKNKRIRVIDGKSFYELATGDPDALRKLYQALPIVIGDILGKSKTAVKEQKSFLELFERVY